MITFVPLDEKELCSTHQNSQGQLPFEKKQDLLNSQFCRLKFVYE